MELHYVRAIGFIIYDAAAHKAAVCHPFLFERGMDYMVIRYSLRYYKAQLQQ